MSGLNKKAFLIFSGYNQRAVVAFCREADRLKVPFCIIAKSKEDTLFQTNYINRIFAIRTEKMLVIDDLEACLEQTKSASGYNEFVLLPSSEFLNRYFLENRNYFANLNCTLPLVSSELYARISDKYAFGELCRKYSLIVPKEFEDPDRLTFPFVAKPRLYFSNDRARTLQPHLILSESDWTTFLSTEDKSAFYYQEFVEGSCFYLLYYIARDGRVVAFSQQNLLQQADGKSMIVARSANLHLEPIAVKYADMLQQVGFNGLIMIELKKRGDEYVMIEANPRLWGPSQLFVDAQIPIFERFILEQGFEFQPTTLSEVGEVMYFWHGGMVQDEKAGKALAYHDYTPDQLDEDLEALLGSEVYLREDTKELFYNESKGLC
jgi:predicted ATP-grasp superfamily ATP-dependent carboligase